MGTQLEGMRYDTTIKTTDNKLKLKQKLWKTHKN